MDSGPSFAELISMREAQQAKIRAALAEQNNALRNQLEHQANILGSVGEGGLAAAAASGNAAVGESLLRFIDDLQKLIRKNHEADIAAFNALQDKFEARQMALEQRLAEMETRALVEERTKELLREEQMAQHLTLCADLESLRTVAESNLKRLDARDEVVASLQSSVHALNATTASLEERLVHVEAVPAALREDIHEIDERFTTLSAAVTAERASIKQVQNDQLERQCEEFKMVINDSRAALKQLETSAADVMEALAAARKRINEQISEGIQGVGSSLERQLNARIDEQTELINAANQRMALEHMNVVAKIADDTRDMQKRVEGSLDAFRAKYDGAVEDKLNEVVRRFEDYEERRKAEFPQSDSERVQLMLQELENAFTMLEGVARNTMTAAAASGGAAGAGGGSKSAGGGGGGGAAGSALALRVDALEARLDELKLQVEVHQPRITFSVPVQATAADIDALSPEEALSRNVERHLQKELELAAVEQGSLQARREALATLNRAGSGGAAGAGRRSVSGTGGGSPTATTAAFSDGVRSASESLRSPSSALYQLANAPETTRGASIAAAASAGPSRSASTYAPPGPAAGAPPQPMPHLLSADGLRSLPAIRYQREQKEAALEKVQGVLHDIQRKFHELTEKEQRSASATSNSSNNKSGPSGAAGAAEAKRVAQLIAQQKEAVYQKERQLIDHRNTLWREICALREAEQQFGAAPR